VLHGHQGDDVLHGGIGDDFLDAGEGSDQINGGGGDDTLFGAAGDDVLTGGPDSDAFVIEESSGDDVVTDFSHRLDSIVFIVPGVDDFGDLTLTLVGRDTLVTWGTSDSLLLHGVRPSDVDASDFLFG
jgi:Ca2+-binding RTX toxin-like protein